MGSPKDRLLLKSDPHTVSQLGWGRISQVIIYIFLKLEDV